LSSQLGTHRPLKQRSVAPSQHAVLPKLSQAISPTAHTELSQVPAMPSMVHLLFAGQHSEPHSISVASQAGRHRCDTASQRSFGPQHAVPHEYDGGSQVFSRQLQPSQNCVSEKQQSSRQRSSPAPQTDEHPSEPQVSHVSQQSCLPPS
jgi:hypothetical protein